MIPRWLKRVLSRFGYNLNTSKDDEEDDYFAQEGIDEPDSPSEPPPLEDMSYLLNPTENCLNTESSDEPPDSEVEGNLKHSSLSSESSHSYTSAAATTPVVGDMVREDGSNLCPLKHPQQPQSLSLSAVGHPPPTLSLGGQPFSRQNSHTSTTSSNGGSRYKDRYVYDPVYGVILQETRDLWHTQEEDSQHRKKALLDAFASEKTIPPVRFSTNSAHS